jgi:hypothetical protein
MAAAEPVIAEAPRIAAPVAGEPLLHVQWSRCSTAAVDGP